MDPNAITLDNDGSLNSELDFPSMEIKLVDMNHILDDDADVITISQEHVLSSIATAKYGICDSSVAEIHNPGCHELLLIPADLKDNETLTLNIDNARNDKIMCNPEVCTSDPSVTAPQI